MWNNFLLIFLGGGLGSVLRFVIAQYITRKIESGIPWGTLVVNIAGSLILGALTGFIHKMNLSGSQYTIFFTIGFCGGFTTFSTFAFENMQLIKNGDWTQVILYTLASVILGILAAFVGFALLK
ncbi:MAG: fluoride efflux transporter CrcB [Crocinitomicaceae bacterium]|nr:fluoride efflux transporter CrcB [Crocinitomicaceae bacterium]|tara:strand:- start:44726 stop:45097 length:372 start_codon:yes stop_codon:yes gene_type:complete